ncbi:MAG: DNA transformation protein [Candidatus Paceibacteria bacterium]|jgi:DNA transformation protein
MATSNEFTNYVLDQLAPVGVILTSKMFGGVMLKIDNKQLGIIIDDVLYFKVKEPELHRKFTLMESDPFEYDRKDRENPVRIRTWWSIPDEVLEDSDQLVGLAYEVLLQGSR